MAISKKRSRIEIAFDIMEVLTHPSCLTHIMRNGNLNDKLTKEMLQILIEKNFVQILSISQKRQYKLTPQGFKVLYRLRNFFALFQVKRNLGRGD